MREFRHFFEEVVDYPESSLANNEKGKVVLFFIINADGTTRGLQIWKSAGKTLDAEAMRIFNMLLWVPATYNEKKRAAEHLITFRFSPRRYRAICKRRGFDRPPKAKSPVIPGSKVYTFKEVSKAPISFSPDGSTNIASFFAHNLTIPEAAIRNGLHGKVKLWFVVEPNGQISNVQIRKSVGGGCNEEAIRVLRHLKWEPGQLDGKAVRSEMSIEVSFAPPNEQIVKIIPPSGGMR